MMIKLRQLLHPVLRDATDNKAYFRKNPTTPNYPYVVYSFGTVMDDGEYEAIVPLDVDGWSDNPVTLPLETLMETVNNVLDKKAIVDTGIGLAIYLDNILYLEDEDPALDRRRYTYLIRVTKGE